MLLNCGVGKDSWESLGLQGNPTVHPKGNQSWIFIGKTDPEVETPILWPPDVKNWLIGKDPDAGKDWRQEENGTTEDEIIGSHHQFNGYEFEQALGVGNGREAWCATVQSHKELDTTEQLNWTDSLNIGAAKYIKQVLVDLKGETDSNIVIENFSTLVMLMDISSKQEVNKALSMSHWTR